MDVAGRQVATVQPGDWTTAAGNDANDGLTPGTPKASLRALLEAYDLEPGDAVLKVLSDAFIKAMQDPEAQAWAKKVRRPFNPMDTQQATAYLNKSIAFYNKYKSSLAKRD